MRLGASAQLERVGAQKTPLRRRIAASVLYAPPESPGVALKRAASANAPDEIQQFCEDSAALKMDPRRSGATPNTSTTPTR